MRAIITLHALVSINCILQTAATPARLYDELPKLSDTLAVAKSPLEPVTVAHQAFPGARNDDESNQLPDQAISHPQTTRAVLAFAQEKDSASTSSVESSSSSPTTSGDESGETSTTTDSLELDGTTSPSTETENLTTTTKAEIESSSQATESIPTSSSPTTTTQLPESTTKLPELSSPTTKVEEKAQETTTTVAERVNGEDSTTTVAPPSSTTSESSVEDIEKLAERPSNEPNGSSLTIVPTTEAPSSEAPPTEAPATEASSTEAPSTEGAPTKGPSTEAPSTQAPSTEAPSTKAPSTESATTENPATFPPKIPAAEPPSTNDQELPVISSITTTTTTATPDAQPIETTTPTTPTTTAAAIVPTNNEKNDEPKKSSEEKLPACNHLPSYDSDEVQKVFREETTFKNGTIKGKFTYINYDQRYRLVHYTRLPYGPVKIDLVEELGKPEQASNQPSSTNVNDIPNAVLQLRNILPNSLFGFPFLGPNTSSNQNKPASEQKPEVGADSVDKSSMYFYSTDSISTPNLLTPSVPVSLLPGQRRPLHHSSNLADTLSSAYYENLQVSGGSVQQSQQKAAASPSPKLKQSELSNADRSVQLNNDNNSPFEHANQNQFQYSSDQAKQHQQQPGFVYTTYLSQPQSQYQYSPVPIYGFHQPSYYPARQPLLSPAYSNRIMKHEQSRLENTFATNQAHQPHSHEHYVAPFMFAQPRSLQSDQPFEQSRLRLKVKTSKSLNQQENLGKSAQLRSNGAYGSYLAPVNSPIRNYQRQRAGKQNNDLRPTVNSSPVVYHVRSPVGQIYTLPQYHQVHALAYDHDN